MILQASKRFSGGVAFNAHYTWSKAIDETLDFNTDFQPHDQLNAVADRALSSFHQKHRFVVSAILESPFSNKALNGFLLAPIFSANSGRPFNLLSGVNNLGDRHPNTHRPLRAGRNIGMGPSYWSADLRISRKFQLGKEPRSLEFIAEVFNLANHTNFKTINNTVGNVTMEQLPPHLSGIRASPTTPFAFTSAFDPRQFQLGLKVSF